MNAPIYVIIGICFSALGFSLAIKSYRRKTGILIRGSFTIGSSMSCDDHFVKSIILENLKDRALTIFAVYLKIGHNYYLEIEDFKDKPIILKAYETYQNQYGAIEFYEVNLDKINLNNLLKNVQIKKQLVLSTSDGKYTVPLKILRWSPNTDFFRNHMTASVRPVRSTFRGNHIGSNIKYVIELTDSSGEKDTIPIHPKYYQLRIFNNFDIPKESLDSKEALENLLETQIKNGNLSCEKYVVHDLGAWRENLKEMYMDSDPIKARYYNAFQYFVLGSIRTKYKNWKSKRANARSERQRLTKHKQHSEI